MENLITDKDKSNIWKIRTVKNYAEASNHIIVGKVLACNTAFVRLHCRTYHFRKNAHSPADIKVGEIMNRVIPWSRIEIINELNTMFDYTKAQLISSSDVRVELSDSNFSYLMLSLHEKNY